MSVTFVAPGLSHVLGPVDAPLLNLKIHELFERSESCCKVFVVDNNKRSFTFAEIGEMSRRFASNITKLGFTRGDRLGVWLPNRFEYVVALIGCSYAGIVLTTMNPAYRASELHHAASLVGIRGLVLQPKVKSSDYLAILKDAGNIPSLDFVFVCDDKPHPGTIPFQNLLAPAQFKSEAFGSCHDAANIQFTSGTTGNPKGAVLSHFNIVNNADGFARRLSMTDLDVVVIPLPLYHCFGLNLGVVATISRAATLVLPSETFDGEATLHAVMEHKGTLLYGVPTMLSDVLHCYLSKKGGQLSLRGGAIGGSPCLPTLMEKLIKDLGMSQIACAYGMTETSPVSLSTSVEDSIEDRCGTVGRLMPHLEMKVSKFRGAGFVVLPLVKIVNADEKSHDPLEIGQVGEILVKGYSVMLGYYKNEQKTKESIQHGFMRTGDLGKMDDRGYVKVVGRSKDMIIRGGENVFPSEVEGFLMKMPGVRDVAVIGVPDERLGEEVCAWIRQHDAPLHDPITVESEFPLTVTGKVQKNVVREKTKDWLSSLKSKL